MIFAECRGSVGRWQGACPESYYTRKNRDGLLHVQGLLKRTLHVNTGTGSRDGGEEPVGTVRGARRHCFSSFSVIGSSLKLAVHLTDPTKHRDPD